MKTRRDLALGAVLLATLGSGGCAASGAPSPSPAQSARAPIATPTAIPATPVTSASATAIPATSASALGAGACRVAADCSSGLVCAYEHAGCDAPIGRCMDRPMVACAAAFPIATCEGTPVYACASVAPEVPWFSRDDGTPHFPYTRGKGPTEIYGAIGEVIVYHVPDEVQTDVAMSVEALESFPSVDRRASSAPGDLQAARSLFTTAVGAASETRGDERWEIVFMGRNGQRLTSIALDKFGAKGEVDGRGVAFAHAGTLMALKALAAHMPKP